MEFNYKDFRFHQTIRKTLKKNHFMSSARLKLRELQTLDSQNG